MKPVCFLTNIQSSIAGFLEDSPDLLGFSLLALCVLLFMHFLYMQSTEIAKQNKQQRPSQRRNEQQTLGSVSFGDKLGRTVGGRVGETVST